RGGARGADRHRRARHDGHRDQGLRHAVGAHRDLPRRRVRRELRAESQAGNRRGRRGRRRGGRRHRAHRPDRKDRRRQDLRPGCGERDARPDGRDERGRVVSERDMMGSESMKCLKGPALAGMAALLPALARAQDAAPEAAPGATAVAVSAIDTGDTAWMMMSAVLVLFMILPGLALFYGGLVRAKNVLSVLMQCTIITATV